MDEDTFALLKADLHGQLALINEVFATVDERVLDLNTADEMQLESVAYQIRTLYNAVEDLLKIVAGHFENRIADTARWHIQLLRCMTQDIAGVRPALLSQETFRLLNGCVVSAISFGMRTPCRLSMNSLSSMSSVPAGFGPTLNTT